MIGKCKADSARQTKSSRCRKPKLSTMERGHAPTWMGDRYVLGFEPAPRFRRSRFLCRLYIHTESPSVETTTRGLQRAYTPMQRDHIPTQRTSPRLGVIFDTIAENECVCSNLVFYAQSAIAVISG